MPALLRDLRYGLRTLRQNPGFTVIAILSLALGIGANTAIFQLLDTVRLRTLPVADPERLVMLQLASSKGWRGSQASAHPALTNPQWEYLRDWLAGNRNGNRGARPDTKYASLREAPRPIAFLSIDQDDNVSPNGQFVIRSSAPLGDVIARTRAVIHETSPEITVDFRSLAGLIAEGLLRERLMATLSSFFGILAALIAALGLYGVMSYLVARRTNEIGVRVALGAGRGDIVSVILRQSTALLAIGLAAGWILAMAAGRFVSSLLFGLKPNDAGTLAVASCCWLPSRKPPAISAAGPRGWSR